MKGLWACSYAVSGFERKVLIRRAGLDGYSPASSGVVAQQLRVSIKRIRRAQRSGVRNLRAANRSEGCALSSPSPKVEETVGALRAVATAPALVTDARAAAANAPASPAPENDGQGEVLGDQRASTDLHLERPQIAGTLSATGGEDGSQPWLLILILSLMAIAASTPLLVRRGKQGDPEPEPEPAPAPPRVEFTPPPWAEPERESPPMPKSEVHHGQRRAAGLGLSAVASLALTLLMRARRRR